MKTKFKVGDKVRVKSLEWYNSNKNINEDIIARGGKKFGVFYENMSPFCGDVIKINSVKNGYYKANNVWRWYDWMLEDEVVTEEKQEDKQLKENDMETKEMTKEEIFEHLNGTKILCTSPEESINVQESLFKLGISWNGDADVEINQDAYLLFIEDNKIFFDGDISYWMSAENKRIEPSEILAIEIKEEKPKFDPNTLKPFDKVLVRDTKLHDWRCSLFSHINKDKDDGSFFICVYGYWNFCVPYNEETQHLVGTDQEAPEYYQIWKK